LPTAIVVFAYQYWPTVLWVPAPKVPPAGLVRVVERVRHVLNRAHQRSVPPPVAVLEKILGAWTAQGIAVAAELNLADALADGPMTIDELAGRVGADADASRDCYAL
jgi:hypothetical protein